jgi:hypothetical protein
LHVARVCHVVSRVLLLEHVHDVRVIYPHLRKRPVHHRLVHSPQMSPPRCCHHHNHAHALCVWNSAHPAVFTTHARFHTRWQGRARTEQHLATWALFLYGTPPMLLISALFLQRLLTATTTAITIAAAASALAAMATTLTSAVVAAAVTPCDAHCV